MRRNRRPVGASVAAGEATGVGGAPLAAAEGRLAGLAAVRHIGATRGAERARESELRAGA